MEEPGRVVVMTSVRIIVESSDPALGDIEVEHRSELSMTMVGDDEKVIDSLLQSAVKQVRASYEIAQGRA